MDTYLCQTDKSHSYTYGDFIFKMFPSNLKGAGGREKNNEQQSYKLGEFK